MAPPDGVNRSAATFDDDFILSEEDMDYGRTRQTKKEGSSSLPRKSAKSGQLGFLPPGARSGALTAWQDVKQNWLIVSVTAAISILAMGGLIFHDYQTTRDLQLAGVQHEQCVRSLTRLQVDGNILKSMGIQSPHPDDLGSLQQNLSLCRNWYQEMDHTRPSGGWSRELVLDFVRKHQPMINQVGNHPPGDASKKS